MEANFCFKLILKGLFELFSSNSTKFGGILDHERDLISLAERITTSKNYYVAKEMKVYELVLEKSLSFNIFDKILNKTSCAKKFHHRKWTKFKKGTICKAIRVVMVDYDPTEESTWCFLNRIIWCCNSNANKRSDMVIEFKIIENFDELVMDDEQHGDTRKTCLSKKSFYLPVNESTLNNDIDLIPISQMVKRVSLNNLQTINNLVVNNTLINNLELKLFDENPFINHDQILKKSKSTQNLLNLDYLKMNSKNSEFLKFNQHLELDKYLSIFELTQLKLKTRILVGFSLDKGQLFFLPVEQINSDFKLSKNKFLKIDNSDEMTNEVIAKFKLEMLENFKRIARNETQAFNLNLNKIETFCSFDNDTFKKAKSVTAQKRSIVNHFSDLVNIDIESHQISGGICFKNTSSVSYHANSTIEMPAPIKSIPIEILNAKKLMKLSEKLEYNSLPNRKSLISNGSNQDKENTNQIWSKINNRQRIHDIRNNTLPTKKLAINQI